MAAPLQLAKFIPSQLIAIIQRDQAAAIAQVNAALVPIAEFHKGPRYRTGFPWLTVGYEDTVFDPTPVANIAQTSMVSLALETGQFDTELAQDTALDYLKVLDTVIRGAGPPYSFADWETALPIVHETEPSGTTTPPPAGTMKWVFIEREGLEVVVRPEVEVPVLAVTMLIRFDHEEAGAAP